MRIISGFIALALSFGLAGCTSMFEAYQRDADIYRMHHLENYGALIKEYHDKTGEYPFEGISDKTIKVSFVTDNQRTGQEMFQSDSVKSIDQEDFRAELEKNLGTTC